MRCWSFILLRNSEYGGKPPEESGGQGKQVAGENREKRTPDTTKAIPRSENKSVPVEQKIGFKGLMLGMTGSEVLKLTQTSKEWGFSEFTAKETLRENLSVLKKGEGSLILDYKDKGGIGTEGPPGKENVYEVTDGHIELSENKVVYIVIYSFSHDVNNIDPYVKDWANFALKGLNEKYGNYDKKFLSIDDINIFSFKENYNVSLYKWYRGDNEIALSLGTRNFKYDCQISFRDTKAAQKELQKSKTKSEL